VKLITAAQTPVRRLANAEDVSSVISFLVSEKANFITGETIRVNGGQFMI
jgi:3-oxoacyl-[acyl-carrier protein] reductase